MAGCSSLAGRPRAGRCATASPRMEELAQPGTAPRAEMARFLEAKPAPADGSFGLGVARKTVLG